MKFRICTWNCRGGLLEKTTLLDQIKADLFISQEGSVVAANNLAKNATPIYTLKQINVNERVLAAIPFSKVDIRLLQLPEKWRDMRVTDPGRMDVVMPFEIHYPIRLNILAVWSFNNRDRSDRRNLRGPVFCALDYLEEWFFSENSIVLGDFNHHPKFDKYTNVNQFGKLVEMMEERELKSVYHYSRSESHGAEATPTHLYKSKTPFHIDYIFAAKRILPAVSFGMMSFDDMQSLGISSDHVPLWIDINY